MRGTKFIDALGTATPSNTAQDPYGEFKRRYDEVTRKMADLPLVTVDPDTVARAVVRAVRARNPKPRYIVGRPEDSLLARLLLTDRMWDRLLMRSFTG